MARKKKSRSPFNEFQGSQLCKEAFELWKEEKLKQQEPSEYQPESTLESNPNQDGTEGNQNMVQEGDHPAEVPMVEPDGPQPKTFPPVLNEIMETLSEQTDFIGGLEGMIKAMKEENQELQSRLVEIEDTEVIQV